MNTDRLIQSLAQHPAVSRSPLRASQFIRDFFGIGIFTSIGIFALVRLTETPLKSFSPSFMDTAEMAAWFLMTIQALVLVWETGHPARAFTPFWIAKALPVAVIALIGVRLATEGWNGVDSEFGSGGCGPLLMVQACALSCWLSFTVKTHLAAVNLWASSLWISLASVGFSGFAMHWLCRHHSAAHVAVWHLIPCFAWTMLWSYLGPKFLRW